MSAMAEVMPVVFADGDRALVSSAEVARRFEKQHKHVLRAIDDLLRAEPKLRGPNFGPTSERVAGPNGGARDVRSFAMDRDGFMLLAMGFTGAEALRWKIRFIEAFKLMEAMIAKAEAANDNATVGSEDRSWGMRTSILNARTKFLLAVNTIYGPEAARRAFEMEPGLPDLRAYSVGALAGTPRDDPTGCLRHLLNYNTGKATPLRALIRDVMERRALGSELVGLGLMLNPPQASGFIAVANTGLWLSDVFANTQWDMAWEYALIQISGAKGYPATVLAGARTRAVIVPVNIIEATL